MFDDIVERLGEIPTVVVRHELPETVGTTPVKDLPYQEPPPAFVQKLTPKLMEDGVPPYLHDHYAKWIYQVVTKQRSIDQVWEEFVRQGVPMVTQHLRDGDPVTLAFNKRLLS